MKQIPAPILTLIAGILITLVSFWVGQHHGLLPEQASEQAPLVDDLFNVMVIISTALFIVVQGAILWFMIRYRKPKGDESDGLPVEGNLPLEAFWTAIPAIIVIGLGIYSVDVFQQMGGLAPGSHPMMGHQHHTTLVAQAPESTLVAGDTMALMDGETAPTFDPKYGYGASPVGLGTEADVTVNVTGMQFAWLFNYPTSGVITGELHIPVDTDVQLNLTAQDVIHAFWVPQFRLKQDALPGQQTGLRFKATKVGTYPVVCAELCGSYHGGMRTQVIVHTAEDFSAWLDQNRVAQSQSPDQVVAANPATMSNEEFLQPYVQDMGMTSNMLAQLRSQS
ncbi:cytochrome c oxidase subunit II [Leptolyngbya sp. AN02str]|uniref:cytochrome c oxidase subunit II n=1 Tax=Leptolyngbya sp. AN02str TaxID=3423363 RepID=UPI003D312097